MIARRLHPAVLLLAAAFSACGACDDDRQIRRIDLGLSRPPRETPPEPPADEPPAVPANEEVAAAPPEGMEVADGEPPATPAAEPEVEHQPAEEPAVTGTAATGVGAAPPQQP